jgi:hypothetical protein
VDPKVQQTLEAYIYVGDDPINVRDPNGESIYPQCGKLTGNREVACDLRSMQSVDFPGLSAEHIALIVSSSLLGGIVGFFLPWTGSLPGGLAGGAYFGWSAGQPSWSQLLIDERGALLAAFVDLAQHDQRLLQLARMNLSAALYVVGKTCPALAQFEGQIMLRQVVSALADVVSSAADPLINKLLK